MEKKLKILLVEDDEDECRAIIDKIDADPENFKLAGVTNNPETAVKYVVERNPDAVILDLELHHGSGDGLTFLKLLKERGVKKPNFVVVTTHNISRITHVAARSLGADFIITKSQNDYSANSALNLLLTIKSSVFIENQIANYEPPKPTPAERNIQIHRKVYSELTKIGVHSRCTGYPYLVAAIEKVVDEPPVNLNRFISEMFGKSEDNVAHAMQNTINRAWKNTDTRALYNNYNAPIDPAKGVPTVKEFVFYYAEKIKNEID